MVLKRTPELLPFWTFKWPFCRCGGFNQSGIFASFGKRSSLWTFVLYQDKLRDGHVRLEGLLAGVLKGPERRRGPQRPRCWPTSWALPTLCPPAAGKGGHTAEGTVGEGGSTHPTHPARDGKATALKIGAPGEKGALRCANGTRQTVAQQNQKLGLLTVLRSALRSESFHLN